ncbi:DUF3322 domain-containing protein [Celeribacter sp.]|uniref:DUF3322 domain-containing protein n=1 Tax=Celeribacter sp. TaxID=1890673 RepID=UPI003A8CE5BD
MTNKNPRHASVRDRISALSDEEFAVLLRLKDWRRANQDKTPALRELQIEGLNTKWVEKMPRSCCRCSRTLI